MVWDSTNTLHKLTLREVLGGCSYVMIWMKCICWVYLLMILYDVSFIDEHVICVNCYIWWWLHMMLCYMKQDITYDLFSCLLDYVELWGFTWALHLYAWDGIVIKGFVRYDVINSITWIVVMTLYWSYSCWYDLMLMISMLTWLYNDVGLVLNMDLS